MLPDIRKAEREFEVKFLTIDEFLTKLKEQIKSETFLCLSISLAKTNRIIKNCIFSLTVKHSEVVIN